MSARPPQLDEIYLSIGSSKFERIQDSVLVHRYQKFSDSNTFSLWISGAEVEVFPTLVVSARACRADCDFETDMKIEVDPIKLYVANVKELFENSHLGPGFVCMPVFGTKPFFGALSSGAAAFEELSYEIHGLETSVALEKMTYEDLLEGRVRGPIDFVVKDATVGDYVTLKAKFWGDNAIYAYRDRVEGAMPGSGC